MVPTTMYGLTKVAGELLGKYYDDHFGLDFRGVRFPGLLERGDPGRRHERLRAVHVRERPARRPLRVLRVGGLEDPVHVHARRASRGARAVRRAEGGRLGRCVYNIAAISPSADEIADAVRARVPGVELTFESDPRRQAILDSWPQVLDDANARDDWGWAHEYDLDRMSDDLVEKVKSLIASEGETPVPA